MNKKLEIFCRDYEIDNPSLVQERFLKLKTLCEEVRDKIKDFCILVKDEGFECETKEYIEGSLGVKDEELLNSYLQWRRDSEE